MGEGLRDLRERGFQPWGLNGMEHHARGDAIARLAGDAVAWAVRVIVTVAIWVSCGDGHSRRDGRCGQG